MICFQDTQRNPGDHVAITLHVDGVLTGILKFQTLDIQHQIACHEEAVRWESHLNVGLEGGHDLSAIVINEGDIELV